MPETENKTMEEADVTSRANGVAGDAVAPCEREEDAVAEQARHDESATEKSDAAPSLEVHRVADPSFVSPIASGEREACREEVAEQHGESAIEKSCSTLPASGEHEACREEVVEQHGESATEESGSTLPASGEREAGRGEVAEQHGESATEESGSTLPASGEREACREEAEQHGEPAIEKSCNTLPTSGEHEAGRGEVAEQHGESATEESCSTLPASGGRAASRAEVAEQSDTAPSLESHCVADPSFVPSIASGERTSSRGKVAEQARHGEPETEKSNTVPSQELHCVADPSASPIASGEREVGQGGVAEKARHGEPAEKSDERIVSEYSCIEEPGPVGMLAVPASRLEHEGAARTTVHAGNDSQGAECMKCEKQTRTTAAAQGSPTLGSTPSKPQAAESDAVVVDVLEQESAGMIQDDKTVAERANVDVSGSGKLLLEAEDGARMEPGARGAAIAPALVTCALILATQAVAGEGDGECVLRSPVLPLESTEPEHKASVEGRSTALELARIDAAGGTSHPERFGEYVPTDEQKAHPEDRAHVAAAGPEADDGLCGKQRREGFLVVAPVNEVETRLPAPRLPSAVESPPPVVLSGERRAPSDRSAERSDLDTAACEPGTSRIETKCTFHCSGPPSDEGAESPVPVTELASASGLGQSSVLPGAEKEACLLTYEVNGRAQLVRDSKGLVAPASAAGKGNEKGPPNCVRQNSVVSGESEQGSPAPVCQLSDPGTEGATSMSVCEGPACSSTPASAVKTGGAATNCTLQTPASGTEGEAGTPTCARSSTPEFAVRKDTEGALRFAASLSASDERGYSVLTYEVQTPDPKTEGEARTCESSTRADLIENGEGPALSSMPTSEVGNGEPDRSCPRQSSVPASALDERWPSAPASEGQAPAPGTEGGASGPISSVQDDEGSGVLPVAAAPPQLHEQDTRLSAQAATLTCETGTLVGVVLAAPSDSAKPPDNSPAGTTSAQCNGVPSVQGRGVNLSPNPPNEARASQAATLLCNTAALSNCAPGARTDSQAGTTSSPCSTAAPVLPSEILSNTASSHQNVPLAAGVDAVDAEQDAVRTLSEVAIAVVPLGGSDESAKAGTISREGSPAAGSPAQRETAEAPAASLRGRLASGHANPAPNAAESCDAAQPDEDSGLDLASDAEHAADVITHPVPVCVHEERANPAHVKPCGKAADAAQLLSGASSVSNAEHSADANTQPGSSFVYEEPANPTHAESCEKTANAAQFQSGASPVSNAEQTADANTQPGSVFACGKTAKGGGQQQRFDHLFPGTLRSAAGYCAAMHALQESSGLAPPPEADPLFPAWLGVVTSNWASHNPQAFVDHSPFFMRLWQLARAEGRCPAGVHIDFQRVHARLTGILDAAALCAVRPGDKLSLADAMQEVESFGSADAAIAFYERLDRIRRTGGKRKKPIVEPVIRRPAETQAGAPSAAGQGEPGDRSGSEASSGGSSAFAAAAAGPRRERKVRRLAAHAALRADGRAASGGHPVFDRLSELFPGAAADTLQHALMRHRGDLAETVETLAQQLAPPDAPAQQPTQKQHPRPRKLRLVSVKPREQEAPAPASDRINGIIRTEAGARRHDADAAAVQTLLEMLPGLGEDDAIQSLHEHGGDMDACFGSLERLVFRKRGPSPSKAESTSKRPKRLCTKETKVEALRRELTQKRVEELRDIAEGLSEVKMFLKRQRDLATLKAGVDRLLEEIARLQGTTVTHLREAVFFTEC
ncbi:hypothetical protein DIPPA_06723 [Diplonema papillatum]|nr:hypothetical protein DIPPA_06723 [Diplonema papillatum]